MNRTIALLLYYILLPIGLWAQPVATIKFDSTDLLIGDEARANIILNTPEGLSVTFPYITEFWKNEKFELKALSDQEVKNGDGGIQITTQHITLIFWDTGNYQLPPVPFIYINKNKPDTFYAEAPLIRVDFPAGITGDTAYVAPIKPIMVESKTFWDYIAGLQYSLFGLLGLVAVFFILYYTMEGVRNAQTRRRKISPEQRAIQELQRLLNAKLIEEKRFADYHGGISSIVRAYLHNRFGLKTLESTTPEVLRIVNFEHLPDHLQKEMKEVLETADLVKFAKASPLDSANQFAIDFIKKMIVAVQEKLNQEKEK